MRDTDGFTVPVACARHRPGGGASGGDFRYILEMVHGMHHN